MSCKHNNSFKENSHSSVGSTICGGQPTRTNLAKHVPTWHMFMISPWLWTDSSSKKLLRERSSSSSCITAINSSDGRLILVLKASRKIGWKEKEEQTYSYRLKEVVQCIATNKSCWWGDCVHLPWIRISNSRQVSNWVKGDLWLCDEIREIEIWCSATFIACPIIWSYDDSIVLSFIMNPTISN